MIDIFPLTSYDIGLNEEHKWDFDALAPLVTKIIIQDISDFGINVLQCNRMIVNHITDFAILFSSQQDLNYYKLVGNIKEGNLDVFSDSGMIITFNIIFALGTEIYG